MSTVYQLNAAFKVLYSGRQVKIITGLKKLPKEGDVVTIVKSDAVLKIYGTFKRSPYNDRLYNVVSIPNIVEVVSRGVAFVAAFQADGKHVHLLSPIKLSTQGEILRHLPTEQELSEALGLYVELADWQGLVPVYVIIDRVPFAKTNWANE